METRNITKEHVPPIVNYEAKDIKLHVYGGVTYFGMLNDSEISKDTIKQINNSEFTINSYYINNTSIDINIGKREGILFTIGSDPSIINPVFIIRNILTFKRTALKSVIRYLSSLSNINAEELTTIKNKLSKIDGYSETKIMIDYSIPLEDIKNTLEQTVYHYQTDTIISTKKLLEVPKHPFFGTLGNQNYLGNVVALNKVNYNSLTDTGITNKYEYGNLDSFHLRIRYVDHSPTASIKYINMFGKVYCLFPEKSTPGKLIYKNKDVKLLNYIELAYTSKNDSNDSNVSGVNIKRLSLEEAVKEIGLYDSFIDAINTGSIESRRKADLLAMEHELSVAKSKFAIDKANADLIAETKANEFKKEEIKLQELKNEAALIKARNDLTLVSLETEQRELRIKQTKLDQELKQLENTKVILDMQRKDMEAIINKDNLDYKNKLERRNNNRKDIMDGIKFIPGVIIAIGGISALLVKNSK